MKKILIISALSVIVFSAKAQTDFNPFESIGKKGKMLTLSNGKYIEVEMYDSLQRIGSVVMNMNTGKIYKLLPIDTVYSESTLDPTVISRWYSIDPKASKFPYISPYASFNNNPIYFVDPTGGENIPALTWARQNMANKGITSDYSNPWYGSAEGGWTFKQGVSPTRVVCYESCFIAYMNSGGNISPLLKETGFSTKSGGFKGRSTPTGGINWFKAGDGTDRSFVTDISKGELGDIVFMGESGDMQGHAVLLSGLPVANSYKDADGNLIETMTFEALSTSSTSDPGSYGDKSFTFQKQKDGSWQQKGGGYTFRGYGQMNEDNMKGDPSLYPKEEATPAPVEEK